jgi:hypothetical protein
MSPLLLASLLLAPAVATAESPIPVRFEGLPTARSYGPYAGTVALTIGRGPQRAVTGRRLQLHLRRPGRVARSEEIASLPYTFTWDTNEVPDGAYQLLLVATDDRVAGGASTVCDQIQVSVNNTAAPRPVVAAPATPTRAPSPTPPSRPTVPLRFRTDGGDETTGVVRLPIDGAEGLPPNVIAMVTVRRGERVIRRSAQGATATPTFTWDTNDADAGVYSVRLSRVDLETNDEETVDELRITLTDRRPVAPAPPSRRGSLPSRGGPVSRLPAISAAADRESRFRWFVEASAQCGDPHPRVAAAQWALETGWGRSITGRNNFFGIKATTGTPCVTHEVVHGTVVTITDTFADFDSPLLGVAGRVSFLRKSRYNGYWTAATDEDACRVLQRAGYATDPGYAAKLIQILNRMP